MEVLGGEVGGVSRRQNLVLTGIGSMGGGDDTSPIESPYKENEVKGEGKGMSNHIL
jgi:hypothetical protein